MEFLAFILGIAGLIWGAVLWKRGGLLAGCLAVMLAGACFSVEFFKLSLGPIPLTADRMLLVVLVGQYLVWRRFGWADPKPLGKPEIVLCLFTAVMILSTFSADYAAANYQPVAWLILYYLMPFGVYWIARQTPLSERAMQCLLILLTLFGVYLAVTSLAEHFEIWWAVFPRYIADTAAKVDAEFVGRARGPFLSPIGNGIALAICFGASLMLWPHVAQRNKVTSRREGEAPAEPIGMPGIFTASSARQEPRPPKLEIYKYRLGQLLLVPLFLLFAAALYVTLTRSVWMGGALALMLIVGLALPWSWRMPLLVGGLLLAIVFSATQWERLMAFKRDKNLDAGKAADSVELRPVLARIAWSMFLDRPLFGCGYAQYSKEHVNYLSDRSTDVVLEKGRAYIQHNVVLSLLTETGLLGLGLFLVLCTLWAFDAWTMWRSTSAPLAYRQTGLLMLAVLGVYFTNGMFHDVSLISMSNMTLFFLAGVTAGLRPEISKKEIRRVGFALQGETPQVEETPILVGEAHLI
jgi:hypothetical protein